MLKGLEDSESDGEMSSHYGYGTQPGGKPDRKKRRGVIEKRRRDRINGSLSELKRLVPQAFEKQGSTKLEKAEILQMTVEHLRVLNSKGLTGLSADPSSMAMDYRGTGFRECVAEVARYLAAVEGLDFNDPLRLRMLSHLEAYNTQRDMSLKANMHGIGHWNTPSPWSSLHGNTAPHSKLGYSFGSSKSSSLHATGHSNAQIDSAYLAASRLSSAPIGLTPMTSSSLTSLPPSSAQPQMSGITAGLGSYSTPHPGQGISGRFVTSQYSHSIHANIKHIGSEYAY